MLAKFLSPHEGKAYVALRVFAGLTFFIAGLTKFGILTSHPTPPMFSQIWIGGVIEVVGGLLIALGLFTVVAAFICSGQMAVAYIQFHWMLRLDSNFFPHVNQGIAALLYCFVFLYIACRGPGGVSLDHRRR